MVTYLFDNKKSVSFDIEVGAQNKFYLSQTLSLLEKKLGNGLKEL